MKKTALIINEFGEVSVDHLLIETAEEKIVLLANGCVCCSVRGDLVQAIRSLFNRMQADEIPPFDRILLETTGLADPGPIVQSLIGPALKNYPVYFDSIVTTVDTTNVIEAIDRHSQIFSQIAVADSLLLTKTDISDKSQIEKVEALVRGFNPRAHLQKVANGVIGRDLFFGQCELDPTASNRELRRSSIEKSLASAPPAENNHLGIHSFVVTRKDPIPYSVLDQFLRSLQGYRGQDLLRVKGLVYLEASPNRPTVIHGVQGQMHPATTLRKWPNKIRETKLVFITKGISFSDVNNLLLGIEGKFR